MSDFWSRRLGGSGPPPATPPTYHPAGVSGAHITPAHASPPPPAQPQTGHSKAPSSLSTQRCPECGSGNYTGSSSDRTKMVRCYDCGYNPRFGQQSGATGMPAGQSGPAKPARQVSTQNNYQPTTVVGRIDG